MRHKISHAKLLQNSAVVGMTTSANGSSSAVCGNGRDLGWLVVDTERC